jgi:hypothetical protein
MARYIAVFSQEARKSGRFCGAVSKSRATAAFLPVQLAELLRLP